MKWNKFLRNAKNKEELININVKFIKSNKLRQLINSPFIVTAENKIYRFEEGQEKINECNHEEADTRIILLASQGTNDVVVVAKNTDVLVLLVWAYGHHNIKCNWFIKYDAEKYANICKICDYLGKDVCESLLDFHEITGSDTTSCFFPAGKVKTFKKILSNQTKLKLIKERGKKDKLSDNHMESAKEFIRLVVYAGESSESYVDTRVRIYKNLKRKTPITIPPDPDSVECAIKWAHFQKFTWLRCCEENVQALDPEESGWKLTAGELKPLWFDGDQFPSSSTTCRQRKQPDGNDADSESSDPDDGPPKMKPRAQMPVIKSKKIKQITRKNKKGFKKKGNETDDKLLPPDDSGEEADEELFSVTNS